MYECAICLSLNHASRYHCQNCGTIPAQYSIIRRPARQIDYESSLSLDNQFIPVVVAIGAVHSCKHYAARVNLHTVDSDKYAVE